MNYDLAQDGIDYIVAEQYHWLKEEKALLNRIPQRGNKMIASSIYDHKQSNSNSKNTGSQTHIPIPELVKVTKQFLFRLTKWIKVRLIRLYLFSDRQKWQDYEKDYDLLQRDLNDLLDNHTKYQSTRVRFCNDLDITNTPEVLQRQFHKFLRNQQSELISIHLGTFVSRFDFNDIDQKISKMLPKTNECYFDSLVFIKYQKFMMEMTLQRNFEELYLKLAQQVKKKLLHYYYIDSVLSKSSDTTGISITIGKLFYWWTLVNTSSTLKYMSASDLLELSSQTIEMFNDSENFGRLALIEALNLRLIGVQYQPVIHQSANIQSVDYASNVQEDHQHSIIHQFKSLIQLEKSENKLVWSKMDIFENQKIQNDFQNLYFFSTLHIENIQNRDSEIITALQESCLFKRRNYVNPFQNIQYLINQMWAQLYYGQIRSEMFETLQQKFTEVLKEYQNQFGSFQFLETYLRLFLSQLYFLSLNYSYIKGDRWKDYLTSPTFNWLFNMSNLPFSNCTVFILQLINFLINTQQIQIAAQIIKLLDDLPQSKLIREECSPMKDEFNIYNSLIVFQIYNASIDKRIMIRPEYFLKGLDPKFYLISGPDSLTIEECQYIEQQLRKEEISTKSIQLGLKLVQHYYLTIQLNKAVQIGVEVEGLIFDKVFQILSKAVTNIISNKYFQQVVQSDIPISQVLKIFHVHIQGDEKYEHALMMSNQNFFQVLEVDMDEELRELMILTSLYNYSQVLAMSSKAKRGEIPAAEEDYKYVQKIKQQSRIFKVLSLNLLSQYKSTRNEYDISEHQSTQLISLIYDLEDLNNVKLFISKFSKIYKPNQKSEIHQKLLLKNQKLENKEYEENHKSNYQEQLIDLQLIPLMSLGNIMMQAQLVVLESILSFTSRLQESVQLVFETQEQIQISQGSNSLVYAHILRLLSLMYTSFCNANKIRKLESELAEDRQRKLKTLKIEKNKLIRWYLEQRVNNKLTLEGKKNYKDKLALMDSQIILLKDLDKGFGADIVSKWAYFAADDSQKLYESYCQLYQQKTQPLIAQIFLLKSDIYLIQKKILLAKEHLEYADEVLGESYTQAAHPDYVRLYTKQGDIRTKIKECLLHHLKVLISSQNLDSYIKLMIFLDLIQENRVILKAFDDYQVHGFDLFLDERLIKFFEQKHSFKIRKNDHQSIQRKDHKELYIEIDKIYTQLKQDPKYEIPVQALFDRLVGSITKDKVKLDFKGLEFINKALTLCNVLYSPDNHLFKETHRIKEQVEKN